MEIPRKASRASLFTLFSNIQIDSFHLLDFLNICLGNVTVMYKRWLGMDTISWARLRQRFPVHVSVVHKLKMNCILCSFERTLGSCAEKSLRPPIIACNASSCCTACFNFIKALMSIQTMKSCEFFQIFNPA